jgi:hypothetical protein
VRLNLQTSNLQNTNEGAVINTDDFLSLSSGGFTKDTTKPKIKNWTLDLDNNKIKVYFDIPISGTLANDKFAIINKNSSTEISSDVFGEVNVINDKDMSESKIITKEGVDNKRILEITLEESFVKELLNDIDLARIEDKTYLKISSSSGIKNISEESDSQIVGSSTKVKDIIAKKGIVNVKFTKRNGVILPDKYNDNVIIKPKTWYHRSMPTGTSVKREDLLSGAFSIVYEYDSVWKTPATLNSHSGYWLKSASAETLSKLNSNLTRATYNSDYGDNPNQKETKNGLMTRIKDKISGGGYKLIGITHNLTASEILGLKPDESLCQVFYHHYDINSSEDGSAWDNRQNIQAGEAIWIRQSCP